MTEAATVSTETKTDEIRFDGMRNVWASIGTNLDPRSQSTVGRIFRALNKEELGEMYWSDGLARTIVDAFPSDALRQWIEVQGDKESAVFNILSEIKARQKLKELGCWARLYGGAMGVMIIEDGGTLEVELNEDKIQRIADIQIYDRYQVSFTQSDLYADANKDKFNTPQFYSVTPAGGSPFRVHETRVLKKDGLALPPDQRRRNQGWGASVIDVCWIALADYLLSIGGSVNIINDFIQAVMTVEGLSAKLATPGGEAQVRKRLEILGLSKSNVNMMLLEKGEEFIKHASSVAGLPDLLDRVGMHLSAVTRIAFTRLFGRSPTGLNNNGESDITHYYDEVKDEQEDDYRPLIERLVWICSLAKAPGIGLIAFTGKGADLGIEFKPLWQPNEKERAETQKTQSEADKNWIDVGMVLPEEAALSRFKGGKFSLDTEIKEELRVIPTREQLLAEQEAEREATAAAAAARPVVTKKAGAADPGKETNTDRADAAPRPLYVSRQVTNADEILAWAKRQGIKDLVAADDLHVTVIYSLTPIDWMRTYEAESEVKVGAGGARLVDWLGPGGSALALLFVSDALRWRHEHFVNIGCVWDWPEYQPHVTLSYTKQDIDLSAIEPYAGRIVLGPERFRPIRLSSTTIEADA